MASKGDDMSGFGMFHFFPTINLADIIPSINLTNIPGGGGATTLGTIKNLAGCLQVAVVRIEEKGAKQYPWWLD
jgi:hypothetical protein